MLCTIIIILYVYMFTSGIHYHTSLFPLPISLSFTIQLSTVQATIVPQSPAEAKKHQLATQLFGGLSGPSRPPKSKQHRKSPTTTNTTTSSFNTTAPSSGGQLRPPRQVAAASKKPKEPQVDLLLDLEGIDFSSPAPAAAPSAQEQSMSLSSATAGLGASVGGGGGGGLLANMEIRGATTQDAAPATSAPPTTRCSIHVHCTVKIISKNV